MNENINKLKEVGLDFMGFIFYGKSKRSVFHGDINAAFVENISGVEKVGIFVNAELIEIKRAVKAYR